MIFLISSGLHSKAGEIVRSALERSCGQGAVQSIHFEQISEKAQLTQATCWVFVDPPIHYGSALVKLWQTAADTKIVVLGALPKALAKNLKTTVSGLGEKVSSLSECPPTLANQTTQSPGEIIYRAIDSRLKSPIKRRPLRRFDFTDEWNNLGYGAVTTDNSVWALACEAHVPVPNRLAEIHDVHGRLFDYAGLWTQSQAALLWYNRPVGPVDSPEWHLVEQFISSFGKEFLPCWPVIDEIPYNFDSAITMRLDCDEDVESARFLFDTYRKLGIPLSLAIHTNILDDPVHHRLPQDVVNHGGAVLSHSTTHAPQWGGNYTTAYSEAAVSRAKIKDLLNITVDYAVAPFHQCPDYSREALSDAGYKGMIGGCIANDPDFIMARAGIPPGARTGFIGHSQQCMLHGDGLLAGPDPLAIPKQAYDTTKSIAGFFGFLDHPFSSRYQYGWKSEAARANSHTDLITHIKASGKVLFCNEKQAMDFLFERAHITIKYDQGHVVLKSATVNGLGSFSVTYRGKSVLLPIAGIKI